MGENQPGVYTILLVEDDESIRYSLTSGLEREGYEVRAVAHGEEALEQARLHKPDLVLLDLMLPDMSGLDVCRLLRRDSDAPIIMVTARDSEADVIAGLEMGADDYVTKPFSLSVLLARVRANLRRGQQADHGTQDQAIRVGPLTLDPAAYQANISGEILDLTPRLFRLLLCLAQRPGQVVTRDGLLDQVWGYDYVGETRTLDVHIHWLREKLKKWSEIIRVETVRGVGYRLVVSS